MIAETLFSAKIQKKLQKSCTVSIFFLIFATKTEEYGKKSTGTLYLGSLHHL